MTANPRPHPILRLTTSSLTHDSHVKATNKRASKRVPHAVLRIWQPSPSPGLLDHSADAATIHWAPTQSQMAQSDRLRTAVAGSQYQKRDQRERMWQASVKRTGQFRSAAAVGMLANKNHWPCTPRGCSNAAHPVDSIAVPLEGTGSIGPSSPLDGVIACQDKPGPCISPFGRPIDESASAGAAYRGLFPNQTFFYPQMSRVETRRK
jgi:hypothetical protein